MCPEVGIEGMAQVFRDVRRVVLHAETLQKVATDSGSQSAQGHNDQELEQLRKEIVSRDSWARARSCRDGEQYSEKETYPPGSENSPTESQKCRRLGVEYVGMKDREVLKTDASRHLIMQDAVQNSGQKASLRNDFGAFHVSEYRVRMVMHLRRRSSWVQGSRKLAKLRAKRGFYEKVTDVNISFLFFFRWGLCFSFRLRRMLFSTVFLYALCMGLRPCAGWGPMEKSMLPVFGRPR